MTGDRVMAFCLLLLFLLLVSKGAAFTCDVYVSHAGLDTLSCGSIFAPCRHLQQAVRNAENNSTICVQYDGGEPYDCENSPVGVFVNISVNIRGVEEERPIFDCNGTGRVLWVKGNQISVSVQGLVMRNGLYDPVLPQYGGGALYVSGLPYETTITNNVFFDNAALYGGAVLYKILNLFKVVFRDNVFLSNSACAGGGAVFFYLKGQSSSFSEYIFHNNTFLKNNDTLTCDVVSYSYGGGAIGLRALHGFHNILLNMTANTFQQNVENEVGGAISILSDNSQTSMNNSYVFLNNTFLYNNVTQGSGGGMFFMQNNGFFESLRMEENKFIGNSAAGGGGGVFILDTAACSQNQSFFFLSNVFQENIATSGYGGGAMAYVSLCVTSVNNAITFVLSSNRFVGNVANTGGGGAVTFVNRPDMKQAQQAGYDKWTFSTTVSFVNSSFVNNAANCYFCSGGALWAVNGMFDMIESIVDRNVAGLFGGGVFLDSGCAALHLSESSIRNNSAQLGNQLYSLSGADLDISNTTILDIARGVGMMVVKGAVIMLRNASQVLCPIGSNFTDMSTLGYWQNNTSDGQSIPFGTLVVQRFSTLLFDCTPCPSGTFSLDAGQLSPLAQPFSCQACPYGAICTQGGADISARAGFWGLRKASTVEFYVCPGDYCCPSFKDSCAPYNYCDANRTGILCGSCLSNFTVTLGSSACRRHEDCHDWWFWLVGILAVVAISIWLVFRKTATTGIPNVLFYFFQSVPLIIPSGREVLLVETVLLAVYNFRFDNHQSGVCPFPMAPTHKLAFNYIPPFAMLFCVAFMFVIEKTCRFCRMYQQPEYQELSDSSKEASSDKYARALSNLLLLTYSTILRTTMELLHCVQIDGEWRLFQAGDQTCYTWWQGLLFMLLAVLILPFPLLLTLQKKWCKLSSLNQLLEGPYTSDSAYWESIVLGRRLILVTLHTFITDPFWQALLLALNCLFFLLLHLHIHPFRDCATQRLESMSLCALTILAILNMRSGILADVGDPDVGTAAEVISIVQTIIVMGFFLPVLWIAMKWCLDMWGQHCIMRKDIILQPVVVEELNSVN